MYELIPSPMGTQPAVSARVKELEDVLGHKLFVRQGRGVVVTPEGREFVTKAEGVLRQLDDLSVSFTKANVEGVTVKEQHNER